MTWSWWKMKNILLILKQFLENLRSKTTSFQEIKSFFRDAKWCFNASWGFKGLIYKTIHVLCIIIFSAGGEDEEYDNVELVFYQTYQPYLIGPAHYMMDDNVPSDKGWAWVCMLGKFFTFFCDLFGLSQVWIAINMCATICYVIKTFTRSEKLLS